MLLPVAGELQIELKYIRAFLRELLKLVKGEMRVLPFRKINKKNSI
jgi:hypothetical protein